MRKIRHLEPYGFNEQPQFDGLVNTVKANIENIKKKNEEQDEKDEAQDKKDEEQDENIKQAIDKSVVSLELLSTPTEGSNRTYAVKQGGNEIGKIEIPFSSLVKSTTYDAENNLLIFTVDNDKEIKVNLTDLIEDADLVQRRIFDDFKNEVNSFSSNTTDSISELVQKLGSGFTGANTVTSVIERNEKVVSASLNDLNDRKLDASAYTPTDLSDYYKKEETSGKTDLDTAFNSKANKTDLDTHISDKIKHITADERTKWDNATDTLATHTGDSAIHITANERTKWNNADANSHTHENKAILDTITAIDSELNENSNNLVVNSAITKVIVENEKVVSAALNDLNDRKLDSSAYTKTDLSDYYKKEETSGKTELDAALAKKANASDLATKANTSDLTAHAGNSSIHITSDERTKWDGAATTLASHTGDSTIHITADERTKWNNAATSSHTHANKAVLDTITAIDTELSETSSNLVVNSAITKVIVANEKITSSSLNDLNDRKLDASAYTPTDLSDYYKKEETSGKTDIDKALASKANASDLTTHISDNIKHITSDERTKWNNAKAALDTHTGDSTVHITADERAKWNGKISSAQYSSADKKIFFYSGATTESPVANIDATDFIKDGMVSNVEIKNVTNSGSCLVITFNADSGKQDINIPVSTIFNPENYYQKTEIDASLAAKADTSALTAHTGNNDIHITADERTKWNNAIHAHDNKAVLDKITAIDTELSKTSGNLVVNSAITKVIVDNEKVVSAALNDLNDRKLDINYTGFTGTTLSGVTSIIQAIQKIADKLDGTATNS